MIVMVGSFNFLRYSLCNVIYYVCYSLCRVLTLIRYVYVLNLTLTGFLTILNPIMLSINQISVLGLGLYLSMIFARLLFCVV